MKYLYFITEICKFVSHRLIVGKYFPLVKEAVMRLLPTIEEYTEYVLSDIPCRIYGVQHYGYSEGK